MTDYQPSKEAIEAAWRAFGQNRGDMQMGSAIIAALAIDGLRIKNEALEEAAKVVEGNREWPWTGKIIPVAAAIRTLKEPSK